MSAPDLALDRAVAVLGNGGLIVYPTETVYGLGADAIDERALDALVMLKGRAATQGLSVLVSRLDACGHLLADSIPADAHALAAKWWPGPLTIVLRAAANIPSLLLGPTGGIGLRCSTDPIARGLVERMAHPLTATSANPSGSAPAASVAEAREYFGDRVGCYLDGGQRASSVASSVVEFFEDRVILRRAGAISAERLAKSLLRKRLEI